MRRHSRFLLPLLALACASNPSAPPEHPLVGTFDWLRSTGGFTGTDVITPAERGYGVRLVFTGSTLRVYHDDELVALTSFTATADPEQLSPIRFLLRYQPDVNAFPFSDGSPESATFGESDHLLLHDGCCDRYMHEFVKR